MCVCEKYPVLLSLFVPNPRAESVPGGILGHYGTLPLPVRHASALPFPATGRRPVAIFARGPGNHEVSRGFPSAGRAQIR